MKRLKTKVKEINKEIKLLRHMEEEERSIQVEKVNAKITGLAEYYKTAICSNAFNYIDDKTIKQHMQPLKRYTVKSIKTTIFPFANNMHLISR